MNWKTAITAVLLCGLCSSASAQNPVAASPLLNPGFEDASSSNADLPGVWQTDGAGPAYAIDTQHAHGGKQSLRVAFKDGVGDKGYSGTLQRLDITALAGKRIEVTAFLRRSAAPSSVGIWLVLADADKKRLLYINSYEQNTNAPSTWAQHKLQVDVPAEAVRMMLGAAIHESTGEMWVDDFAMRTLTNKP
jgi:hypothetical protein